MSPSRQFRAAQFHESGGRPARTARDVDPLDLPGSWRNGDRAANFAPVGKGGDERRLRPCITIESGEEMAGGIDRQSLRIQPRAHRAAGNLPANPAALRQFPVECESGWAAEGGYGGGRRRGSRGNRCGNGLNHFDRARSFRRDNGATADKKDRQDKCLPGHSPHDWPSARRVEISALA